MKQSVPSWQIGGFVFVGALGTLLHFVFDWSGGNVAAALFSAVNESIWEHMKLLFYPMLLFAWWEWRVWGREDRFWCIKLVGVLLGLGLIPVAYYTYTGALGLSADWFNITIFFIAAGVALYTETRLFLQDGGCMLHSKAAVAGLVLIALAFTVLTFAPPQIPLFRDPVTGTYGYESAPS